MRDERHPQKKLIEASRALYGKPQEISDTDRMFGFTDDDVADEFLLDQSIADSWAFFLAISSQWRAGPMGVIGLDLNVVPMMFDIWDITDKNEKRQILSDLRLIEGAALEQMAANRSD